MTLRGFASLGILSPEACKPFDAERNGITIGEGSAVLLVEREGASELALLSAGESGDAYHTTAPHPEGLGAKLAMERALTLAGHHHVTGTEVPIVESVAVGIKTAEMLGDLHRSLGISTSKHLTYRSLLDAETRDRLAAPFLREDPDGAERRPVRTARGRA